MALTEKIKAVADAIRSKTGYTSGLTLDEMPGYIQSIQSSSGESNTAGIPADIVAEAERVVSGMIAKMGGNALTFVALSDTHELGDSDSSDAAVIERFRRCNKNAGQGAWLVSQKLPLDFCAFLGDYCYGVKNTTMVTSYYDWLDSIVAAKGYTAQVGNNTQMIEVPGNHDVLFDIKGEEGTYITNDLISGIIGSYRYVDIDNKKVRVIALNTAEYTAGYISEGRMSGEQLQWFANALDLSGKADAPNWGIIILAHHPLDWDGLENAVGLLTAYINGTNYSVNHNGVGVSRDFTGKNAARVIAQFHGHTHCFRVDNIGDTSVKRVAIPNACFNRSNEYSTSSDQTIVDNFSEGTTYYKNDNKEGKNTAFCLVSIDLDEKTIYADCFGAGYDREIEYDKESGEEDIITYLVTTNLQNATSNGATYAIKDKPYAATITANPGYELVSVTCTMGGNPVSVIDGNIDIYQVTGDIVITAITKTSAAYNVRNLVDEAEEANSTSLYNGKGYKEGVYCSSSGGDSPDGAYVSTGYILYEWKTSNIIYIRGAKLTSDSRIRIYGYEQKGTAPSNAASCSGPYLSTYFTVEYPDGQDEEYYKLTPTGDKITSYIRFSLIGTGENLFITVNEPIV